MGHLSGLATAKWRWVAEGSSPFSGYSQRWVAHTLILMYALFTMSCKLHPSGDGLVAVTTGRERSQRDGLGRMHGSQRKSHPRRRW